LEKFDSLHSGHPVQIVNEEELENKREWKLFFIKIKSEEEKEEVKIDFSIILAIILRRIKLQFIESRL